VTDDTAVLVTGPSRNQVFDALHLAATSYLYAMYALPESLDMQTRLHDAAGLAWRAWKNPSQLMSLADDDPCPCDESDTLWGTCHKWTESLVDLREERKIVDRPPRIAASRTRTTKKKSKRRR
jgi:hypothetical protein